MRTFQHINAYTIEEACFLLGKNRGRAVLNAGGTDLLGILKDEILPKYPKMVINIKTIPGLDSITQNNSGVTIGALTRLSNIVNSPLIKERFPVLAEAARTVAKP